MSENISSYHKFTTFLQNSNYESFKQMIYGSSGKSDRTSCSIFSTDVNRNERQNRYKYKNMIYGENDDKKTARQLDQEEIKISHFDELQRISFCLNKLLNQAKKDKEKVIIQFL